MVRSLEAARRTSPAPDDTALVLPQRPQDPIRLRLAPGDIVNSADAGERLAVFVGRSASIREGKLPVAGRYEIDEDVLTFTPAFGFARGQDYVVCTRGEGSALGLTEFEIDGEDVPAPAVVTAAYPSGEFLPENVLRFYLHFSVPMAPHVASDFVRLRDAQGVPDDAAFMRFKQELWSADRTRLTVLVDPGRIKRGVATNLDLGPALHEGRRYTLTVDGGWPSADGRSVLRPWSKPFTVTAPLRQRPNARQWRWTSPQPGTRDALRVEFDRPFDRHLLSDALHVATNDGRRLEGTSRVGDEEASWSFTPHAAWPASEVRVGVDSALEDVAGNNFRELLDRAVSATGRGSLPE